MQFLFQKLAVTSALLCPFSGVSCSFSPELYHILSVCLSLFLIFDFYDAFFSTLYISLFHSRNLFLNIILIDGIFFESAGKDRYISAIGTSTSAVPYNPLRCLRYGRGLLLPRQDVGLQQTSVVKMTLLCREWRLRHSAE